jgi:hypothetical protein
MVHFNDFGVMLRPNRLLKTSYNTLVYNLYNADSNEHSSKWSNNFRKCTTHSTLVLKMHHSVQSVCQI